MRLFLLIVFILTIACGDKTTIEPRPPGPDPPPIDSTVTFLALGDSYTIGESVPVSMRWPVQLADSLNARGWKCEEPVIIARTGWTTDELDRGIDQAGIRDTFGLVSLLIGVNNQFRGRPVEGYAPEFRDLLNQAIRFGRGDTSRVFVVSIPDYGPTPFGQRYDTVKIARELDAYNHVADSICKIYNIPFFNITPISRQAREFPELVANDGLHPSGEMYRRWVELFRKNVEKLLSE
ncbi:MAG: SGNH/GDSL hydrolase family protein [Bacteroidia bacterium]